MKLLQSIGPNPRVVKIFVAERGLTIERQEIDLIAGENRQEAYGELNPAGQLPALVLDSGLVISEITAICEYLDEVNGSSILIGVTPEEKAEVRMWVRRLDLGICETMANGFRATEGRPMFESRMKLVSLDAAADLKALSKDKLEWLDKQLEGKQFVCGDRFTLADIMLYAFLEFGGTVGQPLDENLTNVKGLYDRIAERPSIAASA